MIDKQLNKKSLSSGTTFSEKYFIDVIKPFFLKKRSEQDYIQCYQQIKVDIATNYDYLAKTLFNYREKRQKILNEIYDQFDLRNEEIFAFKPTQDHLRFQFDKFFKEFNQYQQNYKLEEIMDYALPPEPQKKKKTCNFFCCCKKFQNKQKKPQNQVKANFNFKDVVENDNYDDYEMIKQL